MGSSGASGKMSVEEADLAGGGVCLEALKTTLPRVQVAEEVDCSCGHVSWPSSQLSSVPHNNSRGSLHRAPTRSSAPFSPSITGPHSHSCASVALRLTSALARISRSHS